VRHHRADQLRFGSFRKVWREIQISDRTERHDPLHLGVEGHEQLEENDAERVDVDFVVVALQGKLLRGHVQLGADLEEQEHNLFKKTLTHNA